jgi:hypothetical protein
MFTTHADLRIQFPSKKQNMSARFNATMASLDGMKSVALSDAGVSNENVLTLADALKMNTTLLSSQTISREEADQIRELVNKEYYELYK